MTHRVLGWAAVWTGAVVCAHSMCIAQVNTPEVEPNETKAQATAIASAGPGMQPGDTLSGTTTGASTTIPGPASVDMFVVRTRVTSPGIYRYRLVLGSTTLGQTVTIRGLNQAAGVIGSTDTILQSSASITSLPKFVEWYGFGRGEHVFVRVAGTAATTAPYTLTLQRQSVTAEEFPAQLAPGSLTITTGAQGHASDTDLWLFDSNLAALPGMGNDDESIAGGGSGTTFQSRLTRTLASGTYFLAISNFNIAINYASPADDDFRDGAVIDFPDVAVGSSAAVGIDLTFSVIGPAGTTQMPLTKIDPFQIVWVRLQVGPNCSDVDFNHDGFVNADDLADFITRFFTSGC